MARRRALELLEKDDGLVVRRAVVDFTMTKIKLDAVVAIEVDRNDVVDRPSSNEADLNAAKCQQKQHRGGRASWLHVGC